MKIGTRFDALSRLASIMMLVVGLCFISQVYAQTAGEKSTAAEINQQTQALLKSLKAYTVEQRDEAVQKTKEALDNLDNRINQLETDTANNWEKMSQAAREQSRHSLKSLRDQRIQVAEWYGSLKNSSVGAWDHMKTGFSSAYSALHDAWEEAEKEFSSSN